MSGTLYIVTTPIGNLGDITLRALETLKSVDLILCEDTRVTSKLLAHYNISKSLSSYYEHSTDKKVNEIIKQLENGQNLALVTDAGTPGISDPGSELITKAIRQYNNITIIPIPGVTALTTALSISGFNTSKFLFLGFPPHKKGRQKFFQEVANTKYTVAFYESCHRIKKALKELEGVLDKSAKMCICRELTKKFETIYRGTIEEIMQIDIKDKGEFVVIVSK